MTDQPERVELAGARSPDLPDGDFIMTSHADDTITIDHADPRILISAELIEQAARGELKPEAAFDISMVNYAIPNGHVGALLKIQASNRNVIYRLTQWVPSIRAYVGEWPE